MMNKQPISQTKRQGNGDMRTLMEITDLRIWYRTTRGDAKAVDGVDLTINRNEIFGLAGESGCGKTTLARGILGMTKLPGFVESGEAVYYRKTSDTSSVGNDLLTMPARRMRQMRWQFLAGLLLGLHNYFHHLLRCKQIRLNQIHQLNKQLNRLCLFLLLCKSIQMQEQWTITS